MTRDFGVVEGVVTVPPTVVIALMALTLLGSGVVIAGALGVLYLRGPIPTPRIEAVGLLWVFGLGLRTVLKNVLELPRPSVAPPLLAGDPGRIATLVVDAHGFAFPSGHAANATIAFLGLAWASGHRRAYPVAAVGAVAVAMTRVGLGVHYTGDIVGGILLGVGVLGGGLWLFTRYRASFVPVVLAGIVVLGFLSVFLTPDSLRAFAYAGVAGLLWVTWRRRNRGPI